MSKSRRLRSERSAASFGVPALSGVLLAVTTPQGALAEGRVLTIESVRCIATTDALDGLVVGALGALLAGGFTVLTAGVGTLTLGAVVSAAAAGGAGGLTATDILTRLGDSHGGSPDDLFIKIDGDPIWPTGALDYRQISSQQTISIGYDHAYENTGEVEISLWEWDIISDDLIGSFTIGGIPPGEQADEAFIFTGNGNGVYLVKYRVSP